jgi:lipopolysaccharide export system permease protein
MIKKLDRYLLRHFFIALGVVVIAIGFTIIIINMVEGLSDFIDNEVPLVDILTYYTYFGGWVLKSFFPVFVLLATLFSVSILARRNEILAMNSSAISLYRIAAPFLVVSLLLAVGHFCYNEFVFPPANKKRLEIKEFTIKKHSKRRFTQLANIYRQISPGYFYTIGSFNVERQEGKDLKVYKTRQNRLSEFLTASSVEYRQQRWRALNGAIRTFSDSSTESSFHEFAKMELPDIKDTPEDLSKKLGDPGDMGLEELKSYIDLMKRTGGPHVRESIDYRLKFSYPLASFIVVLISVPLAARSRRGGIAVSFATGAGIALVYFVFFRILQSAGYNEKVPDWLAIWGINGVFFLIGLVTMLTARK